MAPPPRPTKPWMHYNGSSASLRGMEIAIPPGQSVPRQSYPPPVGTVTYETRPLPPVPTSQRSSYSFNTELAQAFRTPKASMDHNGHDLSWVQEEDPNLEARLDNTLASPQAQQYHQHRQPQQQLHVDTRPFIAAEYHLRPPADDMLSTQPRQCVEKIIRLTSTTPAAPAAFSALNTPSRHRPAHKIKQLMGVDIVGDDGVTPVSPVSDSSSVYSCSDVSPSDYGDDLADSAHPGRKDSDDTGRWSSWEPQPPAFVPEALNVHKEGTVSWDKSSRRKHYSEAVSPGTPIKRRASQHQQQQQKKQQEQHRPDNPPIAVKEPGQRDKQEQEQSRHRPTFSHSSDLYHAATADIAYRVSSSVYSPSSSQKSFRWPSHGSSISSDHRISDIASRRPSNFSYPIGAASPTSPVPSGGNGYEGSWSSFISNRESQSRASKPAPAEPQLRADVKSSWSGKSEASGTERQLLRKPYPGGSRFAVDGDASATAEPTGGPLQLLSHLGHALFQHKSSGPNSRPGTASSVERTTATPEPQQHQYQPSSPQRAAAAHYAGHGYQASRPHGPDKLRLVPLPAPASPSSPLGHEGGSSGSGMSMSAIVAKTSGLVDHAWQAAGIKGRAERHAERKREDLKSKIRLVTGLISSSSDSLPLTPMRQQWHEQQQQSPLRPGGAAPPRPDASTVRSPAASQYIRERDDWI